LQGFAGNDILIGGAGADILDGGDGIDTADYSMSTADVVVNLLTFVGAGGDSEGDTYISIENIIGGLGNDALQGGNGDSIIIGGAGNDAMGDYSGTNQLYGGAGNDSLFVVYSNQGSILDGGEGNDIVSSTGGNVLYGGNGDDILRNWCGSATDTMVGGAGADIFELVLYPQGYDTTQSHVIVTDFVSGVDHLRLTDYAATPMGRSFSSLAITDTAAGAHIAIDATHDFTLAGVTAAQLSQRDFQFA
jgi:Ca2+-binding RTX toxin-like protein